MYIQTATKHFGEPLGFTASHIAKRLGQISYAEVEEFCIDLRRRQVLALGETPLKQIVAEQLEIRSLQPRDLLTSNGVGDARTAATAPS